MKALVFAAGLGTRLRPLTDTMPKALVPVGGRTLLEYQIDMLARAGVTDIIINVHHFAQQIVDFVHAHNDFGCHIMISDERDALLDTGGGLRKAWNTFAADSDEPILALNTDILSNIDLQAVMAAYDPTTLGLLVVSERKTQRYLCFDEALRLRGWVNVATGETRGDSGRQLAFSGMQMLSPKVLPLLNKYAERVGDRFPIMDFYLSETIGEISGYVPDNYKMMDVGKIDQLSEAEKWI